MHQPDADCGGAAADDRLAGFEDALERWESGDEPAWESPPLAAGIRGESTAPRLARQLG
ncbi:MAG TPA: hypothetical protein VGL51_16655 [Solirubrobacteraceae bacterium]